MPAIVDATTTPPDNGAPTTVLARARRTRTALLALQAACLVLGLLAAALMGNVLQIASNVEAEDPGFVVHRASSGLVVWDGVGGMVSAVLVAGLVYEAARRREGVVRFSLTGKESIPIPVLPTLAGLLAFALVRTTVATAYAFEDYNRAAALALAWDGEFDTRPSFFTPETYAANQGWGDSTSPEVAARARAARVCCAVLTAFTGLAGLLVLAAWRRERLGRKESGHERVGSVAEGDDERKEVEGREVMEMEHRQRAELGEGKDGHVHEAGGKQVHEMEGGVGAQEVEGRHVYEVEGTHAHEMSAVEGNGAARTVYEMDASEPSWRRGDDDSKWERYP